MMTKQEAIDHFGGQNALAKALGRSKSTASNWQDRLPKSVQFEIQVKTGGQLQADTELLEEA